MTGLEHVIVWALTLTVGVTFGAYLDRARPTRQPDDTDTWAPITSHGLHRTWDDSIEDVVQAHHDDGQRAVAEAETWIRTCAADGPYDHETEGL